MRIGRRGVVLGARLSMIGLLVEDMERSLGFYRALGLPIPESAEEEAHVEVEIGGEVVSSSGTPPS
jgi:hypothetical protein